MDVEGSRVWFTDLWNYSLVPYLLEAVREGLQVGCGKRKKKKFSHSQQPGCTWCPWSGIYLRQGRTFFFKGRKTSSGIRRTCWKQSTRKVRQLHCGQAAGWDKTKQAGERLSENVLFCTTLRPSASVLKLRCACRPYQRASVSPRTCSHQPWL